MLVFLFSNNSYAQLTKIMGTVTDSATGEPLPFVNIVFNGTSIGVTSDFDGNYSIETKTPGDTLTSSFIGYHKNARPVAHGKFQVINFVMISQNIQLEDVVIRPGVNPAEVILQKIVDNKPKNDPDHFNSYQYEAYTKIELDANNITDKLKERRIYRPFSLYSTMLIPPPLMEKPISPYS